MGVQTITMLYSDEYVVHFVNCLHGMGTAARRFINTTNNGRLAWIFLQAEPTVLLFFIFFYSIIRM